MSDRDDAIWQDHRWKCLDAAIRASVFPEELLKYADRISDYILTRSAKEKRTRGIETDSDFVDRIVSNAFPTYRAS